MRCFIAVTIVLAVILCFASLSYAQTPADFYPLSVGAKWVYHHTDADTVFAVRTIEITSCDSLSGELYYCHYQVDSSASASSSRVLWVRYNNAGELVLGAMNGNVDDITTATVVDPPLPIFPVEMFTVGATWPMPHLSDRPAEVIAVGETVETPIGTYPGCVVIDVEVSPGVSHNRMFLADGMGRIKYQFMSGETVNYEGRLVAFAPGADMVVAPTELHFEADSAGVLPATQILTISNNNASPTLHWTIDGFDDWLQVSPTEGISNLSSVVVGPTATHFPIGSYNTTINVWGLNAGCEPQTVDVTYDLSVNNNRVHIEVFEEGGTIPVDTLYVGTNYEIRLSYQNDVTIEYLSNHFYVYSSWDLADYVYGEWIPRDGGYGTPVTCLSIEPGSRADPPETTFDASFDVWSDVTAPYIMTVHGLANPGGGMQSGPLEHTFTLHFTPHNLTGVTDGSTVLNINRWGMPGGEFSFGDSLGNSVAPVVTGGGSYPVVGFSERTIWNVATNGNDITGDGSEGNPFLTIQHAIDTASSGDTVLVHEGTYLERLDLLGKGILLTSEWMYDSDSMHVINTVIDADSLVLGSPQFGSTISIRNGEDSTTVIQGLTITNGIGYRAFTDVRRGGGILCFGTSPIIRYNIIRNNSVHGSAQEGTFGGGIFCFNANPQILHNLIRENSVTTESAFQHGGGIACEGSSPSIKFNRLESNFASHGAGVSCYDGSAPYIYGNDFYANEAEWHGAAIDCSDNSPAVIDSNLILANICDVFSAGIFCSASDATITRNILTLNNGTAVYIGFCAPLVEDNTIEGNQAASVGGIAVNGGSPTIMNNIIRGNRADSGNAGGICVFSNNEASIGSAAPLIRDNEITNNRASEYGGGICCFLSAPVIRNNLIANNRTDAGPLWSNSGGGVYAQQSVLTLDSNTIRYNCADIGGALAMASCSASVITNNTVVGDTAYRSGGGFSIYNCSPHVESNVIYGNQVIDGAPPIENSQGGGIFLSSAFPTLMNNTIVNNFATYRGGGLYAEWGPGSITVTNSIVWGNEASEEGDQIFLAYAAASVSCSDVQGTVWPGSYNFSSDPLFCDSAALDLQVDSLSLCAAAFSPCGSLIGAREPGCIDGCCLLPVRGDVNYDQGSVVDMSDLIYLIDYMFQGGPPPECLDEADLVPEGTEVSLDISDLLYLVDYMFQGGPEPPPCPQHSRLVDGNR